MLAPRAKAASRRREVRRNPDALQQTADRAARGGIDVDGGRQQADTARARAGSSTASRPARIRRSRGPSRSRNRSGCRDVVDDPGPEVLFEGCRHGAGKVVIRRRRGSRRGGGPASDPVSTALGDPTVGGAAPQPAASGGKCRQRRASVPGRFGHGAIGRIDRLPGGIDCGARFTHLGRRPLRPPRLPRRPRRPARRARCSSSAMRVFAVSDSSTSAFTAACGQLDPRCSGPDIRAAVARSRSASASAAAAAA